MARKLRPLLAFLLALGVLAAPPSPAFARKRKPKPPPCSLSGSKTILQTGDSRVFYKTSKSGTTTEYACLFARNKRFSLASGDSEPGGSGETASLEQLSRGGYVAYVLQHYDDATRYFPDVTFPQFVRAINLSTGAPLSFKATGIVSDLVLTKNGSFAWITTAPQPTAYEVHRVNVGDAKDIVVDSGKDIEAGSLAAGSKTLYWTRAGTAYSAPIG